MNPLPRPKSRHLLLLDSIGYVANSHVGMVIVSGSHGGVSAADYILQLSQLPYAVFFNDAGGGKDHAGLAGLEPLARRGVAAAVYSHLSARIGDSADGLAHGALTGVNTHAAALGIRVGWAVRDAVSFLGAGGAPV